MISITREYVSKCFEGIVVDKSKGKLVSKCSKFQIGGLPNHRSQEHLFSVKSVVRGAFRIRIFLKFRTLTESLFPPRLPSTFRNAYVNFTLHLDPPPLPCLLNFLYYFQICFDPPPLPEIQIVFIRF